MPEAEEIYQKYAKTVYRYLLSLTNDEDLAEELTQETFYQAIRSSDRFDGSCKLTTWLCAIAKNVLLTHRRKHPPHEDVDEMAETIRGTLEGVSKGQLEAGYCVGMTWPKIMWHVVLPQAMRTAFPALSNSMIAMLKETSMAATITVMEMFRQAQVINGRVYEPLALYVEAAVIYLIFCTILTWLQHRGEKRLSSYGGAHA